MTHELKILPRYFNAVKRGDKMFEVRKNDRNFRKGDYILLREWNGKDYTGRKFAGFITYVFAAKKYVKEGYVILGFRKSILLRDILD